MFVLVKLLILWKVLWLLLWWCSSPTRRLYIHAYDCSLDVRSGQSYGLSIDHDDCLYLFICPMSPTLVCLRVSHCRDSVWTVCYEL
jgi:hypothetical protein